MPLPTDDSILKTANGLVDQLQAIFGKHSGYRPAHARGTLLTGAFTPTPTAAQLSSAPHFKNASTPITARFSSSTGLPLIPDTDPSANPRGLAIRFHLGDRVHTDVIAHSTPYFPTRTGEGFLQMLQAIAASSTAAVQGVSPSPIEKFLSETPSAKAFVEAPKPSPESFATEQYFGVTALKFVSAEGKGTYFRYRIAPEAGLSTLSDTELSSKPDNYLFDELPARLKSGPVTFKLLAQIAEEGDVVGDSTTHWPEERTLAELGTVELEKLVEEEESKKEQKYVIFDPIPRVGGIEPSEDPLLEMRAAIYLISGKQRRSA